MELREAYNEFVKEKMYDKAFSCLTHLKDYELIKEFRHNAHTCSGSCSVYPLDSEE